MEQQPGFTVFACRDDQPGRSDSDRADLNPLDVLHVQLECPAAPHSSSRHPVQTLIPDPSNAGDDGTRSLPSRGESVRDVHLDIAYPSARHPDRQAAPTRPQPLVGADIVSRIVRVRRRYLAFQQDREGNGNDAPSDADHPSQPRPTANSPPDGLARLVRRFDDHQSHLVQRSLIIIGWGHRSS
jgi:hypothetical protein